MEAGDFFMAFIFLGLAGIGFIIYQIKAGKAKKLVNEAAQAKISGNGPEAVRLYKKALSMGGAKPDMEDRILSGLEEVYTKHDKQVNFSDYRKLIDQTRILSKKSYYKAIQE